MFFDYSTSNQNQFVFIGKVKRQVKWGCQISGQKLI